MKADVRLNKPIAVALAAAIGLASCGGPGGGSGATQLLETGSSLLYPLMNAWVAAYGKSHKNVQITTQSSGSGTGIAQAMSGVAQIGASDAYMSNGQMREVALLNIPLVVSSQVIAYNLPGLGSAHLHLSGPLLAAMYGGQIRYWDDARIAAANPALRSKLPHRAIIAVHRADGSGDTFMFTQYLAITTPRWKNGPGYGTTISWPPLSSVGANGNPGMLQTCQTTSYCVAYIGISFLNEITAAHLGYAALQNATGAYVLPTPSTIASAAGAFAHRTPSDERISLIDAPGANSYPIVNYEYAIVNPQQQNAATRAALQGFLRWALSPSGGQRTSFLDAVHFIPLPPPVAEQSVAQIQAMR
jgi:phosphate transport system substrate-binding protein